MLLYHIIIQSGANAANNITGPLPSALSALYTLSALRLPNNQLTGSLPDAWFQLANLQVLNVVCCSLHCKPLQLFMKGCQPTNLHAYEMQLQHVPDLNSACMLSTVVATRQQPCACSLEHSYVQAGNRLQGSIPAFSGLPDLSILEAGNNLLTGQIPSDWSTPLRLQILSLDSNLLVGSIPPPTFRTVAQSAGDVWHTWLSHAIGN